MITISQVVQYNSVPFQKYQELPGYSTSFLKQQKGGIKPDFVMTDKVRVGSIVDAILTEPGKVDMCSPLYPAAREIAFKLKEAFGDIFKQMVPQVSYTGVVEYAGMKMRVRGRLDFLLPKLAVIDLKVTDATDLDALITFMKYREQMFLYCKFAGVDKAYLIFYVKKTKKCIVKYIDCSGCSEWWQAKIMEFGVAA